MKNKPVGRYLVDYENPDAGIGHSLGHVNNAIKVCMRHGLEFAYSDDQIKKSSKSDFKWRMRQFMRIIVGRKAHETHGIGDAISKMFAFGQHTVERDKVEALIRNKQLKVVQIPGPEIVIPSNDQDDNHAYAGVDAAVRAHPEDAVVFVLPPRRTGDFEYGATRNWFKQCYVDANGAEQPRSETWRDKQVLNVAVHIRRGDLLPGRQFSDLAHRMLPDRWYVDVIDALYRATNRHLNIVILSEGLNGQYCSELGAPFSWSTALQHMDCDVVEKTDHDFRDSFHDMVRSDVLIGSKSGMTHLAGLMNDNIKLVPGMWHSYRGTDHVIELGDVIDVGALERSLAALWRDISAHHTGQPG